MSTLRRILPVLTLLVFPAAAGAQAIPTTWQALLETRIRPAYRYTHPPAPVPCAATELPTTGYLATAGYDDAVGRTWLPGTNQSRWEPVGGPAAPDTLEVRLVAIWCGAGGRSVLVEADGYYLEVPELRLAQVDAAGSLSPGVLLISPGAAGLTQAGLREECAAGVCRVSLTDAAGYAGEVQRQVAERAAAERARLAEADRRVESQSNVRLQAGDAVRAQADLIAQRRRADALQRYGASAAQADAILNGRVLVGMSEAMVEAALGNATATRREGSGLQSRTIWQYPTRAIVFVQGRVTEIR